MNIKGGLFGLILGLAALPASALTISSSSGWLESAFAEWTPVSGASSYAVYYTGNGVTDQKIDEPLIRNYSTYSRADIPGLKAGSYTIKVVALNSSGKSIDSATTTSLTVTAQDRSGFAFMSGVVPGAYKADGTLKDSSVILYITENTKNTVTLPVITSSNGTKTTGTGLLNILHYFKKGYDNRPLVIRMIGCITDPDSLDGGDIVIENSNNTSGHITMEGIGIDAVANGWGIRVKNSNNVEIRNIGIMNVNSDEGDDIGLQQGNNYIWVHNNDYFYGDAGSDADQVKGDGALDCKKSTYVTFSYNHFWDNGKCNLLGLSEGTTTGLYITYHHNWYDHSDSRHPRVRYYSAHVYNNYYDGNAKYGAGSTLGSSVFMEANYFRYCPYPMLTSMQGSDVWSETKQANVYDSGTFSKEDGGTIKAFNNYFGTITRFVAYGDANYANSTVDFDAYVVTSRTDTVPATVKSVYGSNTYNNFDVNSSIMYSYTADAPAVAMANVQKWAGRISQGDFQWTFDNSVDDSAHAVNTALKAAITTYKTTLVSVQGETNSSTTGISAATGLGNVSAFISADGSIAVTGGASLRSVRLFTMGGRLLRQGTRVSVKGLSNGSYAVRVVTDRGSFNQILVK